MGAGVPSLRRRLCPMVESPHRVEGGSRPSAGQIQWSDTGFETRQVLESMAWPTGRYRKVFARLLERDGPDCWLCGKPLDDSSATIEHLIPRSKGGPSEQWNLVLAHDKCNGLIGDLRFTRKLIVRDRARAGWRMDRMDLPGNRATRRRNKRIIKQARKGNLTATVLSITKVPPCGCCGLVTARTIAKKKSADPLCGKCFEWAGVLLRLGKAGFAIATRAAAR